MSISPTGPHHGLPLGPNAQVQNTQSTTAPAASDGTSGAFYAELNFNPSTGSVLGLRTPGNEDDAAALLAEVSLLLEKTAGQSRNDRDQALAHGLVGAFAGLLRNTAILQGLAQANIDLATDITTQQNNIKTDQQLLAQHQQQLKTDQGQLTTDQNQLASDQKQLTTDTATQTAAQVAYNAAVAGGDPKVIAAASAALTAANNAVNTDNTNINNDNTNINNDNANIATDNANIATDQANIATAQAKITADQKQIVINQAKFNALVGAFLVAFTPVAASIAQQRPVNLIDDHGHDIIQRNEFDKIFADLEKFAELAQTEKADSALLQQQQSANDTSSLSNINGSTVDDQRNASNIANVDRALVGLLAGLADTLSTLQQLQTPSTAPDNTNAATSGGSRVKLQL